MGASDKKAWTDPELLLEQWHRYESIAMHFNDLLMRFRTQALGGLATVATIAGLITKDDKSIDVELLVFFGVLLLFWIAAWQLDQRYYSKLLAGAVAELETFEKATRDETGLLRIGLSTRIEKIVGGATQAPRVVGSFYGLIAIGLVVVIAASAARLTFASTASRASSVALPVTFTVDATEMRPDTGDGGTQRPLIR